MLEMNPWFKKLYSVFCNVYMYQALLLAFENSPIEREKKTYYNSLKTTLKYNISSLLELASFLNKTLKISPIKKISLKTKF